MDNNINVTSSPHIRAKDDTSRIMLYVFIALLPAAVFGVVNFGVGALVLELVCIATAVLSEVVFNLICKRDMTIRDLSAVVTGLLLAMNLPSTLPWWMAVIGSAFAIIVVKCLFGGLGQNIVNPALGARCFLLISFAGPMTDFSGFKGAADAISSATPLALLKEGSPVDTLDMFMGNTAGTIGETSVICLLIGALFLIIMNVIDLRIPASYIITFVLFIILFGKGSPSFDMDFIVAHLCGGGLMLGAFFMATDYVTSPITPVGKILFGILLGILTGVFRVFGAGAEGVSYAIVIGNIVVPLIERVTVPRAFGVVKEKKEKKAKEGGSDE